MYFLPIFLQGNIRINKTIEVFKGVALRLQNASYSEQSRIIPSIVEIRDTHLSNECKRFKEYFNSHIGIAIMDSDFIENECDLQNDEEFILLTPVATGNITKKDIFQLILSNWEAKAIRKVLEESGIDKDNWTLLTNLSENSSYIEPFKDNIDCNIDYEVLSKWPELFEKEIYIIIDSTGEIPRKLIVSLRSRNIEGKIIITTSSFEDWRRLLVQRKMYDRVIYTYPKLSNDAGNISSNFAREFGYNASILHLLAYDAASVAIKTLIEAGPIYLGMRNYMTRNIFDLLIGKIGFSDEGRPYFLGKSPEDFYNIKHLNEKGEYKSLNNIKKEI